ncbi:type II toxin-antitoxin system TacA family antitoxin [Marinobacter zhanjiangensis]|uniref:DUF1778 domain-containing protein n=1 Tax=Marinobacter zhanjiangensis TaxID=578215 RepID=A0ABQ3ANW5_9GAMM|nr:DUF1778 domain-containing protein [Marinobacter zhanjiangensis]GGY63253.1 hypothetical protein GCM10007071_07270 [Marinobacter zhanjiangensis]
MTVAAERSKDTRVVARVDQETQQFIAQAAELAGMSVSQFLVDAARSRAEEVVDRATRIQVSAETGNRMLDILDRKPGKPSSKLLRNATSYKEAVNDTETGGHPEEA